MFAVLKTLMNGSAAKNEAKLRDHYALDLIDQKIRETDTALRAAKTTLATQIQRTRSETKQRDALTTRIDDLTVRVTKALKADETELAQDGAAAIADLENERTIRNKTLDRLNQQIERLRLMVEKSQRTLIDLKQGAMTAKAVRSEQQAGARIAKALPHAPAKEAQDLIDSVLAKDSDTDLADIFEEIEGGVSHTNIEDRLGNAGFGDKSKVSAQDVLSRFKSKS